MACLARNRVFALAAAGGLFACSVSAAAAGPVLVIGLDQKASWDPTGRPSYSEPGQDTVAVFDLQRPNKPKLVATLPLENSVTGPPVNIAIAPDSRVALVASAVTNVPKRGGGFAEVPDNRLFVIDLGARRPRLVQTMTVGKQPSGASINSAGNLALVAYRGETSVGVFRLEGGRVREAGRVEVGAAPAHVVFTPDGRRALAVKQEANRVALLDIVDGVPVYRGDLPTGNGPYNVVVTPDGRLAVTSDRGSLTVIDLEAQPARVIQTVKVESGSEGLAVSPDGRIAVSVALRGSNAPPTSSAYHEHGAMVVLEVDRTGLTPLRTIELGRVPEGVAFSPKGDFLYVGNFADGDLAVFAVRGTSVVGTGMRQKLPGHPASLRASQLRR